MLIDLHSTTSLGTIHACIPALYLSASQLADREASQNDDEGVTATLLTWNSLNSSSRSAYNTALLLETRIAVHSLLVLTSEYFNHVVSHGLAWHSRLVTVEGREIMVSQNNQS